ncbi:MAG: oligoribonuclease [Deltaproteobacteria bacterium]|nr:oligoribonuclease [Deltaproteobacteria bacterium]MBW2048871.1 oligoribonuclease [Deltaproteobacteria bacterium]MBW2112390.1 oligoribonuclease [Deltaproteobacteria bacterium]MBW2352576.1 oligoribonuclease [Deltaproteobacteria bacterium]HDZ89962.1 oligoribonuclease [Deltaproteobacteria bacterium]
MKQGKLKDRLVWIDLEMTGLDPERDVILEIATVITDQNLELIAEGPDIPVNHPEKALQVMDEWNRTHHGASGLIERVKSSPFDCQKAEEETLKFVKRYCGKGESPLCGNSVWQDRRFLIKQMPRLEEFFHYRIIDVSSVKELVRRWCPRLRPFEKRKAHLALSDIKESIEELRYYRDRVFIPPSSLP